MPSSPEFICRLVILCSAVVSLSFKLPCAQATELELKGDRPELGPVLPNPSAQIAQTPVVPRDVPSGLPSLEFNEPVPQIIPRDTLPPGAAPLPQEPLPTLPPPGELLPLPTQPPAEQSFPGEVPVTVFVERFVIEGSTVFDPDVLAEVAKRAVTPDAANSSEPDGSDPMVNRPLSFSDLLQARSAITQFYTSRGYITSGALIPPQTLQGGIVTIQVIEGRLEAINITGTRRLNTRYVRNRLAIAAATPLNQQRLLEGLQLLQLDPLIRSLSADLQAGARPGTSVLQVAVTEADTLNADLTTDNGRSPSVGSFRRQVQLNQANLLGLGDGLSIGYTNTDGSDEVDASYTVPLNPRNGTLSLSYGRTSSDVIEPPFDALGIQSTSSYYELTYRQPLRQTLSQEFALGLTASFQESQTKLSFDDIGPFPLSPGADDQGRTRVSALRFFQEWTQRSSQQVLAFRSQFSLGLNLFNATINDSEPDSQFLSWRGQGQWVRLLAPDTLLLLRSDVQLASNSLLAVEQFGLGGQQSVRGYRQDALLSDNGALISAELRFPILQVPEWQGVLQLTPFADVGTAWNVKTQDPNPNLLAGVGLGLLWRQGDRLTARIDWGIPLVSVDSQNRTLQENGLYFSIGFSPF